MTFNIVPAIGIPTNSIMRGFCANLIIESISSMFFLPLFFIYLGQSSPLGSPKI